MKIALNALKPFAARLLACSVCLHSASAAAASAACSLPAPLRCPEPLDPALVAARSAETLIVAERWEDAFGALAHDAAAADGSPNYGLSVRVHAARGLALAGLKRTSEARRELEQAVREWTDESALRWIRSLPANDISERAVERAAEAVGTARVRLAEFTVQRLLVPPPRFALADAELPFENLRDAELTASQRRIREAFRKRYRRAMVDYMRGEFARWLPRHYAALASAEREYEQAFLIPPALPPHLRVRVYARLGALWADFARLLRGSEREDRILFGEQGPPFYSSLGEVGDREKERAREAFERCVSVSREHRILTEDTLVCEEWLGTAYRGEFPRPDELTPYADMRAPTAWLRALPPCSLGER
jgi:hypothetical protein